MSSVSLQPKVGTGTKFFCSRSFNHSAQKNAFSWKSKLQTTRTPLRVYCMQTWNPMNNKKFETMSYVPPLSEESIAKEVDYILSKGWVPCLEFDQGGAVHRTSSRIPGYYDGRYWTLWKLPMFGCTDSSQVLREIEECKNTYPNAYIKLISFDGSRQCQCLSFVIQKPPLVANETA